MPAELLQRLRRREPAAQSELRERYFARTLAVCRHLLRDAVLANEAAEDLWTDFLVAHVDQIESPEAIPAYLRLMAVRRSSRLRDLRERHDELGEHHVDPAVSAETALADESERRAQVNKLQGCLSGLHPRSRRILRLRFHHGMTQEQIGDRFGISKQYIGRVLAKCLAALRQCLEET